MRLSIINVEIRYEQGIVHDRQRARLIAEMLGLIGMIKSVSASRFRKSPATPTSMAAEAGPNFLCRAILCHRYLPYSFGIRARALSMRKKFLKEISSPRPVWDAVSSAPGG